MVHDFEPDGPIFTPRIWLARRVGDQAVACFVGCARRSERGDGRADQMAWTVGQIPEGTGILLTTYDGTIEDVRVSWQPAEVRIDSMVSAELTQEVWSHLHPTVRVGAMAFDPDDVADGVSILP